MYAPHPHPLLASDRRHLVRAAARLLGPADAEDAVQDAYVRALEAQLPAPHSAQAWLLTVMRNLAIDRLRRRQWMQQWLAETAAADSEQTSPSAEMDAALAQEATQALRLLAARLTPAEGAALLLLEVFEASHAEIAQAGGKTEAGSRQQLRRALLRLRQAGGALQPDGELEPGQETVFRLYLQSLQLRNPQTLWALLRQPPVSAMAQVSSVGMPAASTPHPMTSGVVQIGGQLGLVLTLDGVTLCVLPLGVRAERETTTAC